MKKILTALLAFGFATPALAENEVIYDPSTDSLHLPKVIIQGDTTGTAYEIDMQHIGDLTFSVTTALDYVDPNTPPDSIPEQFSVEFLEGRTFYLVHFGTGDDENGNLVENVPTVSKLFIIDSGTSIETGLLYASDGESTFEVNASGELTVVGDENEGIIPFTIGCGSTEQYIEVVSEEGVDLWFYSESRALVFAFGLSAPIPRCM